ncbi:hypothetical protein F5B19DRAFT_498468 [Rostrohypoxylon terebratum]|nr:hypothetical protein F5B19DRAFT_498468 [Rostrohypoxylon terebratum]
MHPCRLLTKSSTDYPITAQLLNGGMGSIGSTISQTTHALLHLGLRMRAPPQNLTCKLNRFYYADIHEYSALAGMGLKYLPALFINLTHLDLCISVTISRIDIYELRDFIMGRKSLTHLRLCFERSYMTNFETGPLVNPGSIVLNHPQFYLPKLRYLHISHTGTRLHIFLKVVKRHAGTLRFLRADENFPAGTLQQFVDMSVSNELDLDDLVIIPFDFEHIPFIVFNEAFKTGELSRGGILERYIEIAKFAYIRGLWLAYDMDAWRTAAIVDSRSVYGLPNYKDEYRILDAENQDWRDGVGNVFHIGHDDDDDNENPDQDPVEARENASNTKRLRKSPWWEWRSLFDGRPEPLYLTDAQISAMQHNGEKLPICPTEVWRFQHRNGEVAFGDDPLEYWEDWEGSDAGDSASPTPFGNDRGLVRVFRLELSEMLKRNFSLGLVLPSVLGNMKVLMIE